MKNKIIEKFRDDANELNQSNIVDIAIKDVIVEIGRASCRERV